jgi:hypothetical protein
MFHQDCCNNSRHVLPRNAERRPSRRISHYSSQSRIPCIHQGYQGRPGFVIQAIGNLYGFPPEGQNFSIEFDKCLEKEHPMGLQALLQVDSREEALSRIIPVYFIQIKSK